MTNELYVYTQDQRERKRTASGARARKVGSRSKRCTLPSDHMTTAQKRQLNGKPETVNLNRPMTYQELKKLSPTMQFLYLDHLVTVHKARRVDLASMLGTSNVTMGNIAKRLPGKLEFSQKAPKHQAPEWHAFLEGAEKAAQEAAQAPEAETQAAAPDEPQEAPVAATEPTPAILAGSIKVRCTAIAMLGALLRILDDPNMEYEFEVSFTR